MSLTIKTISRIIDFFIKIYGTMFIENSVLPYSPVNEICFDATQSYIYNHEVLFYAEARPFELFSKFKLRHGLFGTTVKEMNDLQQN